MSDLATVFVEEATLADGTAIRPLGLPPLTRCGGDSIVAFIGACDIPRDNIVDVEDDAGRFAHLFAVDAAFHRRAFRWRPAAGGASAAPAGVARDAAALLRSRGWRSNVAVTTCSSPTTKLNISIATATPVSCKIPFRRQYPHRGRAGAGGGPAGIGVMPKPGRCG